MRKYHAFLLIRFSISACSAHLSDSPSDVDDPKMHVYQGFERWGTWKDALSWVAKDPDSRSGLITIVSLGLFIAKLSFMLFTPPLQLNRWTTLQMFDLKPNPELVIMPKAAPEALAFWAIDDPDDQ